MADEAQRKADRRNKLLDDLQAAEAEWGARLQTQVEKEAAFLRKIVDARVGAGSSTNRIQEGLTDLTVDSIEDFLTGGSGTP